MSNYGFNTPLFKRLVLPAFVLFLLVVSLMVVPAYYADKLVSQKRSELSRIENNYRTLYSQVSFLLNQYAIYRKYGDLFFDLEKRGLVSSEKRPVWLDNILLFGYAMQFSQLSAGFRPQAPVQNKRVGNFRLDQRLFKLNPITFKASLPVDIDFLRLVTFVHDKLSVYSYFDRCEFKSPYVQSKKMSSKHGSSKSALLFSSNGVPVTVDMNCQFNIITSHPRKRNKT